MNEHHLCVNCFPIVPFSGRPGQRKEVTGPSSQNWEAQGATEQIPTSSDRSVPVRAVPGTVETKTKGENG